MLFIIIFHIVLNVIKVQLTNADSIEFFENGYFNEPRHYKRIYILYSIMPLGKIANGLFILISGYFMVAKGKNINILGTAKKLLCQLGFASLAVIFLCFYLYKYYFAGEQYIKMKTLTYFYSELWFIGYYFLIILIGYLYLNKFLYSLNKNQYLTFIIIALALCQLNWAANLINDLASGLRTVVGGVFLYALGGFIAKYNPFEKIRLWFILLVILLTYGIIYLSSYNQTTQAIEDFYKKGGDGVFYQSFIGYADYSIVIFILAVAIFEIFRRIKPFKSRIINFLGAATFMVYLYHANSFVDNIWNIKDWVEALYIDIWSFCFDLAKWIVLSFLAGVALYTAYLLCVFLIQKLKFLAVKK